MEFPTSHLYTKKIKVTSGTSHGYTAREGCITILYHAIENTVTRWEGWVWYSWTAVIDGKVRRNTDECETASQHSDWLYFLWHGTKGNVIETVSRHCISKDSLHYYCSYCKLVLVRFEQIRKSVFSDTIHHFGNKKKSTEFHLAVACGIVNGFNIAKCPLFPVTVPQTTARWDLPQVSSRFRILTNGTTQQVPCMSAQALCKLVCPKVL